MNQIPPEAGRLHIRSLTPEDYPLYDQWEADLHRMHVEARPDLFCPLEHPVPQEQYLEELNDCHELRLLAEVDGVPAGMCSFTLREAPGSPLLKPDKSLYVVDLYVAPLSQTGVASALLAEGERQGRAFGAKRLSLTVWPFNQTGPSVLPAAGAGNPLLHPGKGAGTPFFWNKVNRHFWLLQ